MSEATATATAEVERVNVEIICDKCGGPRDAYVGRLQPKDGRRRCEPQEHNDNEVPAAMLTNGLDWVLRFSTCPDCREP